MYAIVEMAGQQFKVAKDQKVYVHRLDSEEGNKVTFDKVLLLEQQGNVTIGAPVIEGAAVEAKVVKHLKGDKVLVFKKKRRKGFRKKNGHRQYLTEIVIESIIPKGARVEKAESKKAEPVKAERQAVEEKSAETTSVPVSEAKADSITAAAEHTPKGTAPELESMTVAELKEVAKEKGISGISSMKKAELIEAIKNS